MEAWPAALIPNEVDWGIRTNTLAMTSPWTGGGTFYELQGARWECTTIFRNLPASLHRELLGLLDHLRGGVTTVALPLWMHEERQGGATGSMTVTADAHAKLIDVAGIGGTNPAFKRGDMVGIAGRLYRVTKDATATAGAAEVSIAPPLRAAASAASLVLTGLTVPMRLTDDDSAVARFRPKPLADVSVSWLEALP